MKAAGFRGFFCFLLVVLFICLGLVCFVVGFVCVFLLFCFYFFSLIFVRWISDCVKFCFLCFKKIFAQEKVEERATRINTEALQRP